MNHGGGERSGYEPLPSFGGCLGFYFWLHNLGHEISHGFRSVSLDLPGSVGVGAKGESCVVVPQHTADRFHIYAALQGYRGECVSKSWGLTHLLYCIIS